MSAAEVNIPLLRKAVEWAEAEAAKPLIDREWDQDAWVIQPHERVEWLTDTVPCNVSQAAVEQVAAHCGTAYCIAGYVAQTLDARYATEEYVDNVHVSTFAAKALGLPPGLRPLFSTENTIADVRRIAEDLAGEPL